MFGVLGVEPVDDAEERGEVVGVRGLASPLGRSVADDKLPGQGVAVGEARQMSGGDGTSPGRDSADRRALEAILGVEVGAEPWPDGALPPGCRVRVIRDTEWDGPWAVEFTGTIDATRPPHLIGNPRARTGELAYFVQFDAQQYDSTGDGPFRKAQIWGRYLEPL